MDITDEELQRRIQAAYDAGVRDGREEALAEKAYGRLAEQLAAGHGTQAKAIVFRLPRP